MVLVISHDYNVVYDLTLFFSVVERGVGSRDIVVNGKYDSVRAAFDRKLAQELNVVRPGLHGQGFKVDVDSVQAVFDCGRHDLINQTFSAGGMA